MVTTPTLEQITGRLARKLTRLTIMVQDLPMARIEQQRAMAKTASEESIACTAVLNSLLLGDFGAADHWMGDTTVEARP